MRRLVTRRAVAGGERGGAYLLDVVLPCAAAKSIDTASGQRIEVGERGVSTFVPPREGERSEMQARPAPQPAAPRRAAPRRAAPRGHGCGPAGRCRGTERAALASVSVCAQPAAGDRAPARPRRRALLHPCARPPGASPIRAQPPSSPQTLSLAFLHPSPARPKPAPKACAQSLRPKSARRAAR